MLSAQKVRRMKRILTLTWRGWLGPFSFGQPTWRKGTSGSKTYISKSSPASLCPKRKFLKKNGRNFGRRETALTRRLSSSKRTREICFCSPESKSEPTCKGKFCPRTSTTLEWFWSLRMRTRYITSTQRWMGSMCCRGGVFGRGKMTCIVRSCIESWAWRGMKSSSTS